jgi:hypothetical protein
MPKSKSSSQSAPQFLHLVFGGELKAVDSHEFREPDNLDVVGIFPDYPSAYAAWKGAAQRTVDNAMMRYFVVPLQGILAASSNNPTAAT